MNYKPLTQVDFIVVHCAATSANLDIGEREIDRWHRERGFFSIGYHAVIRRDGTIEGKLTRKLDQPGAHVSGHNWHSLGVCLVGGVDGVDKNHDGRITQDEFVPQANFTEAQATALAGLLKDWQSAHPKATILGHTDLDPKKACPSFNVRKWLAAGMPSKIV